MPKFTEKRKKRLIRNPDGSFKKWIGGKTGETHHGTMIKFGKYFKKQHGRKARVGDVVIRLKTDGSTDRRSNYHIKTQHGWREAPSKTRKPTKTEIRKILENSRKGR